MKFCCDDATGGCSYVCRFAPHRPGYTRYNLRVDRLLNRWYKLHAWIEHVPELQDKELTCLHHNIITPALVLDCALCDANRSLTLAGCPSS